MVYYEKGGTIWGTPFILDLPTAIEGKELAKTQIDVSPNPTEGQLSIQSNSQITKVEVWNMMGELIISTAKSDFDLGNNPSGIYLVQIHSEEGISTEKIQLK